MLLCGQKGGAVYMAKWIPVRKAAQIRKCSERNIYLLIKKGVLQSKKEGGHLLILMDIQEEDSESGLKVSEMISILQKQLEEKDKQIENLQKQLEDSGERHDTIVLQLTRQLEQSQLLLEHHKEPWYRRVIKGKYSRRNKEG
jgi:hypothetical protein